MITSNLSRIGFKKSYSFFIIISLILLFTVFFVPQKASAQAFVPVKDQELINEFRNFNNAIVGSIGGGTYIDPTTGSPVDIVAQECATTTLPGGKKVDNIWYSGKEAYFDYNGTAGAYKKDYTKDINGIWSFGPITQGGDLYYTRSDLRRLGPEDPTDPAYYDNPQNPYFFLPNPDELKDNAGINNSTSINCLLQEMVEWEKLRINMQMHAMVKEYFTDAQTYMLSQQLLSTLAAATIEWSNKELAQRVYIDGVATTTKGAIYPDNIYEEGQGTMSKELAGILAQIEEEAGVEGLGLDPLEIAYLKEQVEKHYRSAIESRDAADITLKKAVEYTAPPAGNSTEDAYIHAARNSALNVTGILESAVAQRMTQAADNQKAQWEAYGGYLSVLDCGVPGDDWYDPYCRTPRLETPGNMLGQNLYQASQSGIESLRVADELGETTGTSSQELAYQLQQRSLRDYEIQQLLTNQQTPQELFNEFEFVLTNYYGINKGTTNWSRNMLVNTWDDIMWGSGAPRKAEALGKRLDEIILEVESYGTP